MRKDEIQKTGNDIEAQADALVKQERKPKVKGSQNAIAKTEASAVTPATNAAPPELPESEVLETAQATHELGDEAYQQGYDMVRTIASEQRRRQAEGIKDAVIDEQRVNSQFRQGSVESICNALRFQ